MKRFTTLFLVFCLVLSSGMYVFASEENGSKVSELILLVKNKLEISDDDYEFEDYHENTYYDDKNYSFSWKSKNDDKEKLYVEIKEDGTITSYDKSFKRDYKVGFLKLTKDDAEKLSREFLNKIGAPQNIKMSEISKMGDCYRFLYNRVYNDIEVEGNYLRTEVSGNTGEVINYYAYWNDLDFKDEKVKSIDEAKNIYKDKLGYDIFYKVKSEDYENNAKLIYKTKYDENAYIDAVTGEIKTNRDFVVAENAKFASLAADTEQSARGAVLSEKELKMIDNIKGFISKFDALTIVKNIEEFEVDDKYVLNSSEIYRKANGKYVINISVSTQNEKKESFYKYFTLDADTGTVIGFNQYASVYIDNENEEFDNNEGKKIAESFLKKYYGKEFESCVFAEKLTVNDGLYEYKKVKDEVKVVNNGFTVRINKATGKIDSFSYTEDDALYESQDNIKGLDDVYGKLLTEDNFRLKYIIIPDGENKNDVKPFLVYKTEENPTYDAKTLEKISAYTLEKDDETVKPEYTDIAGHYAENYIKRLLDEDIYLEGNELKPNEPITNKEFASLLYMVFSGSKALPLDVLYKNAVSYFGLDEEFEEEAEITRLDAIKMFIEKMGYKEFAEIEGIFNCPFDDIEEKDKGYVSIAAGLKLISTEDKLFYKDNLLKKCDALIIIYNYMAR